MEHQLQHETPVIYYPFIQGGLAIATPGEVAGFYKAWQMFGVLTWAELFTPAIQLCEEGFVVERSLSDAIADYEEDIRADPNLGQGLCIGQW